MRFLGIDLGDARTGLALGDRASGIATPLTVVEVPLARREELVAAILARVREAVGAGPCTLVLGLPLEMEDAREGARAALVRGFGDYLARSAGLEVRYHDERLTTEEARWALGGSGLTRGQKKARRDAVAAAAMLRDFLTSTEN